jgi:hypothetical protein
MANGQSNRLTHPGGAFAQPPDFDQYLQGILDAVPLSKLPIYRGSRRADGFASNLVSAVTITARTSLARRLDAEVPVRGNKTAQNKTGSRF